MKFDQDDRMRSFRAFMAAYPIPTSPTAAAKAYAEVITSRQLHEELMRALRIALGSDDWVGLMLGNQGKGIPHANKFIMQWAAGH